MIHASVQTSSVEQDERISQALRASLKGQSDQYREWRLTDDARILSGPEGELRSMLSALGWKSPDPRRLQYLALEVEKRGLILDASALIGEVLRMRSKSPSDDALSIEFCIRNGNAWLLCSSSITLSEVQRTRIVTSTMKRYYDKLDREDRRPNLIYDLIAVVQFGGTEQMREFLAFCHKNEYEHLASCATRALQMGVIRTA